MITTKKYAPVVLATAALLSSVIVTAFAAEPKYSANVPDGLRTPDKVQTRFLPAPIPINNFWSFMVYSGQHRSMLETDQKFAGLDSNNPSIESNQDGSYTMWFGPKAPQGHEGNWIQTMSGKSYNVILRLYGPLKPWFDKSWKPGDLELVE